MAKCRYCDRGAWNLRVNADGLCPQCAPAVTASIQSIARVISESLDLVERSKKLDTRLSRCDVVIDKAKALMAYQAVGIPTISPPPNQLVAQMEERKRELIAEADEESGGKVPPGVFWADYIKKLKVKPD